MSCWRALSRLDVVVKKEMNADRPPRRYSNHKQLRDSSSQLLISSPAGTRAEFNPFSPTIQELGRSAGNIPEVSPLLTTSISPENTYAYASNFMLMLCQRWHRTPGASSASINIRC
jgi:hypothetical protein